MPQDFDYSQDQDTVAAGDNILLSIAQLAREQKIAEDEYNTALEEADKKKDALNEIRQRRLPELMQQAGQDDIKTADGLRVECKDALRASISEANQAACFAFLEENGVGSIIKYQLTIDLPKGEESKPLMNEINRFCLSKGVQPSAKMGVHNASLVSNLKQLLEAGADVPLETFGAVRQFETKVSLAKPVKTAAKKKETKSDE